MHLHIYIYVYIYVCIYIYIILIIDFYSYMSISVFVCVCIGDIFTLHQSPLLHPTLGPSARPSVRRMGTKSATPRRPGADTVTCHHVRVVSTRVFWGFLAINHQPIRGYIRVKGWGLSHYSWGFTCFLEFSPRKIGEMESNLTVASVSSGWEKTTTGSTRNFEILNQGKAQNMYCFDGSQPETWDI